MKQMMNEVNPKAGTLKQTNEKALQNVSRKLVAFVLMLAITLQPALVNAATHDDNGEACCTINKIDSGNRYAKLVKVSLPSARIVNKADSEITANLYKSLNENKVKQFAAGFAAGDAEIIKAFEAETSITLPASLSADEAMTNGFYAENIRFNQDVAAADQAMNSMFNEAFKVKRITGNVAEADEMMSIRFMAENINLPSADLVSKADAEIIQKISRETETSAVAIK